MSQLTQQQVTDAIVKGGFHRFFANPQQAMTWPGITALATVLIENTTLKAENEALKAQLASGATAQAPQIPQGDPWASTVAQVQANPAPAPIPVQTAPQAPTQPQTTTLQKKGVRIEIDSEPETPYKTSKRTLGEPLPPPKASLTGANEDASKLPETVVKGANPNYMGAMVPPAPDPQESTEEIVLDFGDAPKQPSEPSAPQSPQSSPTPTFAPPPMYPAPPQPQMQPLTADQIPPDVMARINAPFPQINTPMVNTQGSMNQQSANYLDGILDGV